MALKEYDLHRTLGTGSYEYHADKYASLYKIDADTSLFLGGVTGNAKSNRRGRLDNLSPFTGLVDDAAARTSLHGAGLLRLSQTDEIGERARRFCACASSLPLHGKAE